MADFDNSVGLIYQRRSSRTASESDKLSPNVKDAMDRIFPKSPSKFLQSPFSDNPGMLLVGNRVLSSNTSVSSALDLDINQPFACTVSNAHITTDTTTTATAIFTGLTTSASGTKSPIMSSVPAYCNDIASLPASAIVKNSVTDQNGVSSSQPKNSSSKGKMNRMDELDAPITPQVTTESPRLTEKVFSESDLSSQSETMLAKEKKRVKKRKKHRLKGLGDNDSDLSSMASPSNGYNFPSHSPVTVLVNGELNAACDAAFHPPSIKVQQKLPRVKRVFIHISKDIKYINKKFLPSYVVMEKITEGDFQEDNNLSLPDRVKHLSEMCLKNHIDCPKFKSIQYRNIFEECLIQNSEDEFISPRGRSLRKRNQNVSYVEPSEDDLLDDLSSFSRKKKAQNKSAAEDQKKDEQLKEPSLVEELKKPAQVEQKDKVEKFAGKKSKTSEQSGTNQSDNRSETVCKTGTLPTVMKDDKGRSLVYVYPKGSLQNNTKHSSDTSGGSKDEKSKKKKRMGPASKTNQPLNLSTSSLTTLSLPRSLLGGSMALRGITTLASSSAIPSAVQPSVNSTSTTSTPQFYMVKIDGKDFLVPVMTGSGGPRPGIPGFPGTSSLLTRAPSSTVSAHPFSVSRLPPVMIPGMPMTTGIRMFSPALSTSNILSNVPLIGGPQLSTSCIPVSGLSQIGLGASRPSQLVPSSVVSNVTHPPKSTTLTSLVRAPLATSMSLMSSISQSALTTRKATSGVPNVVAPLAAPASTTVLRSTRPRSITTIAPPVVTSNSAATSTRCFRIIVPGCSATGMPARIATLGSNANSSPLTRMAVSSSLLPQRKRSADEMSPEKRAAKRRRLEKKYPLPPGVVIKTEPDEVPTPTVTTVHSGSVRSLLGQNIQLITSAARGGSSGSMQNIRLVSPITGSRQMRLGANFIIRTPNNSTVNLSSGPLSALAASASSLIVSPATQSGSVSLSTPSVISRVSLSTTLPSTTLSTITTAAVTKSTTTTASSQFSTLSTTTSGIASEKITTLSYSVSTSKNPVTASSSQEQTTVTIDSLKGSISGLQKLISTQENAGLKGPRLEKLKEILAQKKKALNELEKEQNGSQLSGVTASDSVIVID